MPYLKAAQRGDLWPGEMVGLVVAGVRVLLVNLDGTVYAYEDRCSHLSVPLSEGRLREGVLTCGAHEWQYDARTGTGLNPACARLRRLPVYIEEAAGADAAILVDVGGIAPRGSPPEERR